MMRRDLPEFIPTDPTQVEIAKHLNGTRSLLEKVTGKGTITPYSDLGYANNVDRMLGGFFTGAVYSWDESKSFVPIDSTVNACAVSVHKLSRHFIDESEFDAGVQRLRSELEGGGASYLWNFSNGNHFISYCTSTSDGSPYIVLHSSAPELKYQLNGLYPVRPNWYSAYVQQIAENGRHLRYIEGTVAELFYETAKMLHVFNRSRHQYCAFVICGDEIYQEEFLYSPHYGMPERNSVAIGVQWIDKGEMYGTMLTDRGKPLYVIQRKPEVAFDERVFLPHGFGKCSHAARQIQYLTEKNVCVLKIGDLSFKSGSSLAHSPYFGTRHSDIEKQNLTNLVQSLVDPFGFEIADELEVLFSVNSAR